jgi:hemerythrin-like domain-containing protein
MSEPMKKLVNRLVEEHRLLLTLIDALEVILSPNYGHSFDSTKLGQMLKQIIELMAAHSETEKMKLSPALQRCLPEVDYWQIKMLEIQDEAIYYEAIHLHEWLMEHPSPTSFERLQKDGARLIRWVREHIGFEEGRLFPRLL